MIAGGQPQGPLSASSAPVFPWAHTKLCAPIMLGAPQGQNKGLLLWEHSPSTWPVMEQATMSVCRLTKLTCTQPASQAEGQQSLVPLPPFPSLGTFL